MVGKPTRRLSSIAPQGAKEDVAARSRSLGPTLTRCGLTTSLRRSLAACASLVHVPSALTDFPGSVRFRRSGNTWNNWRSEASSFSVRRVDDLRVDVQCRLDARVPELLLRDLDRHSEVVQQRRVNVAERRKYPSRDRPARRPGDSSR